MFWASHDPTGRIWSTQYKAVLWTHGPEQERKARASIAALTKKLGRKVTTELAPAPRFWVAEDYHQKYYLRKRTTLIEAVLGDASAKSIRDTTTAARLNGWIAGHGTKEQIATEVEALKISQEGRKALGRALGKRAPASCGVASK